MNKASYQKSQKETKVEWLTPPYILKNLGEFDLDPCAPINRPWDVAKNHLTIKDNGLAKDWSNYGRIFLNPPYTNIKFWTEKMRIHNNGIMLVFARTETKWFFKDIWITAKGILFLKGRLKFYNVDGTIGGTSPASSCLISYGNENDIILRNCNLEGKYIRIN